MKTRFLILTTLLAIGTSMLAIAAPKSSGKGKPGGAPPVPPELLAKYDSDGDGVLSDAEKAAMKADLDARRAELIAKYDTNGDGVLDATERAAAEAAMQAARMEELKAKFASLDTDSSGGLSLTEFNAGAPKGATTAQIQAAFTKADTDSDGSLTLAEFTATAPKGKGGGRR